MTTQGGGGASAQGGAPIAFWMGPICLSLLPDGGILASRAGEPLARLSARQTARLICFLAEVLAQPDTAQDLDFTPLLGYYEGEDQDRPKVDPGTEVPCPICHAVLRRSADLPHKNPLKTISLRPLKEPVRSLFYRVHKRCYESLSTEGKMILDEAMFTAAERLPP